MKLDRTAVAALVGGAALFAGGGSAFAAQGDGDRGARCQARVAKIAEMRGVSVEQLRADVQARLTARVDAALAAGRISPERAAKLKQHIAAFELCKGAAVKAKIAKPGMLRAAAKYLGLNGAELRAQLPGTSLGALAVKRGKTVEGLKAAMLAPAQARLAKAVERERITPARAEKALDRIENLIDRLVAKTFPAK